MLDPPVPTKARTSTSARSTPKAASSSRDSASIVKGPDEQAVSQARRISPGVRRGCGPYAEADRVGMRGSGVRGRASAGTCPSSAIATCSVTGVGAAAIGRLATGGRFGTSPGQGSGTTAGEARHCAVARVSLMGLLPAIPGERPRQDGPLRHVTSGCPGGPGAGEEQAVTTRASAHTSPQYLQPDTVKTERLHAPSDPELEMRQVDFI